MCANWPIGQQIVEAEQGGAQRAGYGQALLKNLAARLANEFGAGFSLTALKNMRGFYLAYPQLIEKGHALRDLFSNAAALAWRPGQLHTALTWMHYRALLKVAQREARDFYEIEVAKNA